MLTRTAASSVLLLALIALPACDTSQEPAEAENDSPAATAPTPTPTPTNDEFVRGPTAITGIEWEWVSTTTPVEETIVPEPARYTILLEPDGKLRARFDCNRGGGNYELTEGKLSFGPMMSTRAACPPDSLDAPFMRDLERVTSFFVRGGELYLEMPYDSGTLRFRKSSA